MPNAPAVSPAPAALRADLPRRVVVPVAILLTGVALHLLAVWTATQLDPDLDLAALLQDWDGGWYLDLSEHGYPEAVAAGDGAAAQTTLGFYPLYPLAVRAVATVTPFGPFGAGLAVAVGAAAAAAVAIGLVAERLTGPATARRAVALVAFAPGAIVLSMTYSESTLMLLAAVCMLALGERRWLVAGAAGALAGLARPNALAVVAACGVAALVALRSDRRDLRPMVAPALAVLGFAALPVYHWFHAGDPLAYWRTQHRGWGQGFDFGWSTLGKLGDVARDPLADFNLFLAALGVLVIAGGLGCMWAWRPPAHVWAYTLVIVGLALGSDQLVSTMRFTLTAFPLAIAYAHALRGTAFGVAMGVSGGLLALLSIAATGIVYTP